MRLLSRVPRFLVPSLLLNLFLLATALSAQAPATTGSSGSTGSTGQQPLKIDWKKGPFTARLGDNAEIKIPAGFEFADAEGARRYLENTGNPSNGDEVGILTPIGDAKKDDWVVLFDYEDTGYVRDTEKTSIDAPKLLERMKEGVEEDNKERQRRGWLSFHLKGWQTEPFYDQSTHNLTWATLGNDDEPKHGDTVNYSTRMLGRRGVMRVDLVLDPSLINDALPRYQAVMSGFTFTQNNRYADFIKGDKVAEYGLTALIAGGATAVAMKTGLFAKLLAALAGLWKIIAVGFAALMTRIKNIWAAITGKFKRDKPGPTGDDV